MLAISSSPAVMTEVLACGDKLAAGELPISELVDGFVSEGQADDYVAEEDDDSFDDEGQDEGGEGQAMTRRQEEMKAATLEKFVAMRASFSQLGRAFERHGHGSAPYRAAQMALSEELMSMRFTVKTIDRLCGLLRQQIELVRRHERDLRRIAVERCEIGRAHV